MNEVKRIHAQGLRRGTLSLDQPQHLQLLIQKVLNLQHPDLPYAHSLLSSLTPYPNTNATFLFNRLLQAYSRLGPFSQCILLYARQLLPSPSSPPNSHSFTFLFSACASFRRPHHGRALHAHLLLLGLPRDPFLSTSLLDMYSKCSLLRHARHLFDQTPHRDVTLWNSLIAGYSKAGDMANARELFERMPERNVISWTAMVSGYAQNGMHVEAVEAFMTMRGMNAGEVRPNAVTLASVLPACGSVGALGLGMGIEEYARGEGLMGNTFVGNALVEMYGKCGSIADARRVFEEMGGRRNLCSWNSMITGLAVHGKCTEALRLFGDLKARGFTPDDITFVGVLLACTHGGLVDEGKEFFESMKEDFSITPKLEHYGCMVDLLGRSGLLEEAYAVIKSMPMEPDSVIWGALLGACSFHREVELAEIAAEFLFKLEPWNPGNHVILSNIYASSGQWNSVAEVWKQMKGKQQRKSAGYSIIESDGIMHKFLVEDKSHPRCRDIYFLLDEMTAIMRGQPETDPNLEKLGNHIFVLHMIDLN